MPASRESVSSNRGRSGRPEHVLLVSPSWLGDSLMAMPALFALRRKAAHLHVTVLAKPAVLPVWGLCPAVNDLIELRTGWRGMRAAIHSVASCGCDFAYVIPNSFRSAWIPFRAGIPGRRGFPGHCRRWLLTEAVRSPAGGGLHQSIEMFHLLGVEPEDAPAEPLLSVPEMERQAIVDRFSLGTVNRGSLFLAGLFPGAARGPAKCWPMERFAELGKRLVGQCGCRVVLFGSAGDTDACEAVANRIGQGVVNLAGRTGIQELVTLLSLCRVVVANDSGGMHLAAAAGTRVVALYGITDPVVTGPMGKGHVVLMSQGVERSRDIPRRSAAARASLEALSVDSVFDAAARLLAGTGWKQAALSGCG